VRQLHGQATPGCRLASAAAWAGDPPCRTRPPLSAARRLNRILDHAVGDFTVDRRSRHTAAPAAGNATGANGQWLAIDWPWGSEADGSGAGSVGGLVARGLAGGLCHRYLGVRDQLIGIGLMRTDGVAARAGGKVVKNVAGYDLMRLFTGSWGVPRPDHRTDPAHHPRCPPAAGPAAAGTARSPRWPAPLAAALQPHAGVDRLVEPGPEPAGGP